MFIQTLLQLMPFLKGFLSTEHKDILNMAKRFTGQDNEKDIIKVFQDKPELIVEFQKIILEHAFKHEEVSHQDRHHARTRDLAFIKSKRNNIRANMMVGIATLGLMATLISLMIFSKNLSGEVIGILSTIAGIFGACLKDVYAFEFGSSRESKEKDESMNLLIKNQFSKCGN